MLARWSQTSGEHISSVQAYYDHTYRRAPNQYCGVLNTFDLDAQHHTLTRREVRSRGSKKKPGPSPRSSPS